MALIKVSSKREQVLIAVLSFSVLVSGYLFLRVKPMQTQGIVWDEQLQDSLETLNETRPLKSSHQSIKPIEKEIEQLKLDIEREKQTLAGFKKNFVDLSQDDAQSTMRRQITEMARRFGLRPVSIRSSKLNLHQLAGNQTDEGDSDLNRPLFDMEMVGSYFSLDRFISNLNKMPNTVVITKITLLKSPPSELESQLANEIRARLTLGF